MTDDPDAWTDDELNYLALLQDEDWSLERKLIRAEDDGQERVAARLAQAIEDRLFWVI